MKAGIPRRSWRVAIMAILLALGLVVTMRSMGPMDVLQPSRPIPFQSPSAPPIEAPYVSVGHLIASRYVLNDLLDRSDYLSDEARHLADDTDYLWSQWKNTIGIRGSSTDWLWYPRAGEDPASRMHSYKIQTDLFRHRGRATRLEERAQETTRHLRDMEGGWNKVEEWIMKDLHVGQDLSRFGTIFEDLRQDLSKSAAKLNALDADVRVLQQDLDDTYTQVKRYFRENVVDAPRLDSPWHWEYMLSDSPRPNLQYELDSKYQEYLERSKENLTKKTPLPKQAPLRRPALKLPALRRGVY